MARPNRPRTIGGEANLAQRIATEREQRAWSYDTLAHRMTGVGCSIQGSAIYKIEKGEPRRRVTVDELVALSQVFGIDVPDLLTPMELVRKQRAKELIDRIEPIGQSVAEAVVKLLDLYIEYFELAAKDKELAQYVHGHWFPLPEGEDNAPVVLIYGGDDKVLGDESRRLNEAIEGFELAIIDLAGDVVEASLGSDPEGSS